MAQYRFNLVQTVCAEPYRLFFPLGILIGISGVGHWLAYGLGWLPAYSGLLHASIQVQGYMTCFILGFLLTFLPRFTSAAVSSRQEILGFFILMTAQVFALLAGRWMIGQLCFIGLLIHLVLFAKRRFTAERASTAPPEFVWIPTTILHGVTGAALLILTQLKMLPPWLLITGKGMVHQGFLLSIVLGIGGFLAPRLMGIAPPPASGSLRHRRLIIHLGLALALFFSFWWEGLGGGQWAYGLRALVVVTALLRSGLLLNRPRMPGFFLRLLWVSFWMVAAGYGLSIFWILNRVTLLHVTLVGGYSLMTFAVATMVVLSHGGEGELLQKRLPILQWIAAGLAAAVILRASAVFFPSYYFQWLAAGSACWLAAAVSWLCFILPRALHPPDPAQFEQLHEQMKQRIADLQGPHAC